MEIYIAWTILSIFIVFAVIPILVSYLVDEPSYLKSLSAGLIFFGAISLLLVLALAVLWSAIIVMRN